MPIFTFMNKCDRPTRNPIDLLDELENHATRAEFVYSHAWQDGDLVMWDNRCTLHRATPFRDDLYVRDMRRTTVADA